jgi:hypothetical protein
LGKQALPPPQTIISAPVHTDEGPTRADPTSGIVPGGFGAGVVGVQLSFVQLTVAATAGSR